MRIHAGLLDALHDRSAQVVNPLRAAKRPRRREALTFFDHVELSGGYGFENAHKYGDKSINTYNLGAKVKFLDENTFDTSWVPALAVGGVYKYTDSRTVDALGLDDDGFDAYVVASKLIPQTLWPILVSAGLLLLDEVVNGVVGHNEYDVVAFGNLDVLPAENVAIGIEYKQGVDAGDGIRIPLCESFAIV